MRDFDDSTLWRISAYERMRLERSSSVFAHFGENTILPTTLLADLRHLEARREHTDSLEVLAACLRHRQSALLCLSYEDFVWPVTVAFRSVGWAALWTVIVAAAVHDEDFTLLDASRSATWMRFGEVTVIDTVAGALHWFPSEARYVKLSGPE